MLTKCIPNVMLCGERVEVVDITNHLGNLVLMYVIVKH